MSSNTKFASFKLAAPLLTALQELGYETPSPVQEQSIPILMEGADLIAQAQTGTGKTAAFALPILHRLNLKQKQPQVLVLTPTRELAIQVAEAFQSYARHLSDFHVLPVYGGQHYDRQLRALKRGVQVIVGTPGRTMDHMRQGKLSLNNIKTVVLDEADEMLNMGFLEDVKWILDQAPKKRQIALFSATMPTSIQQVAKAYLNHPQHVKIQSKTMTAANVIQSAMVVAGRHKLEALTRYLEVEKVDGVIIFARTKTMTAELAEKLAARGYSAAALNGDMNQRARESVVERVKSRDLDIIVATDVAARGLDVERLSHVINYDAPHDAETYVHRIGRTGRAGREGRALLMVIPREQHHLRNIERATKQKMTLINPPTVEQLNEKRIDKFTAQLMKVVSNANLDYHRALVEKWAHDHELSELEIAAALLKIAQQDKPLHSKENDPLLHSAKSSEERPRRNSSRRGKRWGPKRPPRRRK